MAHSSNIISHVKLPNGTTYEIHDAQAIHSAAELGLSAALVFKGTKATDAEIKALTSAKVGDVWHSTASDTEYVCVTAVSGTANADAWEEFGPARDAASSSHTHNVTVTGTNAASSVTGTVTVPTVTPTQKHLTATAGAPSVSKETADAITGFGSHTTASVPTALTTTTVKNPTVTEVSIPNVTGNSSVTATKISSYGSKTDGTAASWGASVTDGVLSFSWTANKPTAVTMPTGSDVSASKVTLGTALSASSVTTSNVTVATGAFKTSASAITALGTPTTAAAMTSVTVGAPAITLAEADSSGTGSVPVVSGVTVGSKSASLTNGSAAAQKWTQASGVTGAPQ